MYGNNKQIRAVADIAAQIMAGTQQPVSEELKGDQHKIDKNKNGKIDGQDFKILKGQKANEEVESVDEAFNANAALERAKSDDKKKAQGYEKTGPYTFRKKQDDKKPVQKEEVELEEGWDDMLADVKKRNGPQPSGGSGVKQGTRYGGGKQKDTPEQDEDKPKKKMSEMVALYKEGGFKALEEAWAKKKVMKEEPDNEQFTAELEKQKKKAAGTATDAEKAKVAAPASQGCVDVKEETEQLDELKRSTLSSYVKKASRDNSNRSFDHGDDEHRQYGMGDDDEEDARVDREEKKIETRQKGIDRAATRLAKEEVEELDERTLTASETEKKEDIVKGMKKSMAGFKERYGDRAKSVMYATATKQAMKEETESEHYKAGHEHAVDHAMDSGFKVTARARKKEMLADNPHKPGTPEHKEWHRGALDGHQTGLDNM